LFNGGLGILSRLVPQLQVMFVATPISILVGLGMLFILLDMIVDGLARDVMKALANLAGG
jgi:flagellar biosynthetic protein FliR